MDGTPATHGLPCRMPRLLLSVRFLLVLVLGISAQGLLFVQGAFLLRQDVIVARYCVDRDVPESDCHGRCFLKERMRHDDPDGGRPEAVLSIALSVRALLPPTVAVPLAETAETERSVRTPRRPASRAGAEVFHPPRVG